MGVVGSPVIFPSWTIPMPVPLIDSVGLTLRATSHPRCGDDHRGTRMRCAAHVRHRRICPAFPQRISRTPGVRTSRTVRCCDERFTEDSARVCTRRSRKERGQAPLRHTLANRPLLPSGPGGVELLTVAQDLTSTLKWNFDARMTTLRWLDDAGAVELIGIEPTTSSLRTRRSPS